MLYSCGTPLVFHLPFTIDTANEPYELWEGMDRRSQEYKALKEERADALWKVSSPLGFVCRPRARRSFASPVLNADEDFPARRVECLLFCEAARWRFARYRTSNRRNRVVPAASTFCPRAIPQAVERVVPDARKMAKTVLIGSPLTHERFNRRRSVGSVNVACPPPFVRVSTVGAFFPA